MKVLVSLNNINCNDFAPLQLLPNLIELNLSGAIVSKKSALPALPKLLRLNLQNNQISINDAALFEKLSFFISLEYLNLSDNQLENILPLSASYYLRKTGVVEHDNSPLIQSLKSLDISRNKLQTLYPLVAYSGLENLFVSGNQLNETISLTQMINLKTLSIDNCGINNIDFLKKLLNLQVLNISNNNINDFAPLYELKKLRQLSLGMVTKQVLEKLKKELPKTNIIATVIK